MSFNEQFQVSAPCRYSYTSTQRANLTYDNTRISKERLLKHLRLRHHKTDEFVPIKTEKEQISLGRKITVATIFAIAGDLIFCKGKHIKSILSNLKCNKSTPKITAEVKTKVKPVTKLGVKPEIETEVKPESKHEVNREIQP